jgi:2-methylcitrate dehydratase PrpD
MSVIDLIAQRVGDHRFFSELAVTRAKQAIIDTIGCIVAGAFDEATQSVATAFQRQIAATGDAFVIGRGRGTPSLAALVNGTAAHCLDFDDNFHPARAHASAVLVPALLAVATSSNDITGRQFVEAYLAGLEAQAAVGFGVNPSHYTAGWHGTSTVGCIGTAAGIAKLLGGDVSTIARAMSIAVSFAAGPKAQFGTPAKPLHAGMAARNAVEAGYLAFTGMTGRNDVLEGPQGFLELFGGATPSGWEGFCFRDANIIETRGLVTKLHPCCGSTHRAIDAVIELQNQSGFHPDNVEKIEIKVGIAAARNLAYPFPRDEMQARFSMQYCVAVGLLYHKLRLSDFSSESLKRNNVMKLMPRISMTSYTTEEEVAIERLPHLITIFLSDGTILSQERLHARGSIEIPLTEEERYLKFKDCLEWGRSTIPPGTLYQRLSNIEESASISETLSQVMGIGH